MDASEFNGAFDELVSPAFTARGGRQAGRRLIWESGSLTVALLRTEPRNQPPPRFTLCIRHTKMRGLEEQVPETAPTNPSAYMIKVAPSSADAILRDGWRYEPYNTGRFPFDEIDYHEEGQAVLQRLGALRTQLDQVLPRLDGALTPAALKRQLQANGSGAWVETMWIEDVEALDTNPMIS